MKFLLGFLLSYSALLGTAKLADEQGGSFVPDEKIVFKKIVAKVTDLKLRMLYPDGYEQLNQYPAIVLFFGGVWKGGAVSQFYSQAKLFASRGLVAICSDYGTKQSHATLPFDCVEDGKAAMRFFH